MRRYTLGLLTLALAGCHSKSKGPTEYQYAIRLAPDPALPEELEVEVEGVTAVVKRGQATSFTVARDHFLSDPRTRIVVKFDSTCGPVEVRGVVGTTAKSEEQFVRDFGHLGHTPSIEIHPETVPAGTTLYVDNFGGTSPHTITIGKLAKTIAAGKSLSTPITTGTCAESNDIRVDGEKIGTLFPAMNKTATLVDAQGGHCYVVGLARYGASVPGDTDARLPLSGDRVFQVRVVDYFLTPPPKTITIVGDGTVIASELQRMPCKGRPATQGHGGSGGTPSPRPASPAAPKSPAPPNRPPPPPKPPSDPAF